MRNRKEQEEAVRRLNRYIRYIKSCGNTQSKHFKAVVIVLNMLKQKDAEIVKYKKLLVCNLAKGLDDSIKASKKANTDLEDLDKGWQVELEKKDKEIEKLRNKNKELLRKLRNRVKEVKKLTKYSLYKKEFSTLNKQIKKKDKMIDLMAGFMLGGLEDFAFNAICKKGKCVYELKDNRPTEFRQCKNCIKQYFERKAE